MEDDNDEFNMDDDDDNDDFDDDGDDVGFNEEDVDFSDDGKVKHVVSDYKCIDNQIAK